MATLRTIANTGSSSNRIDMVFLGDGYTAGEIATTYNSHVNGYLDYLFGGTALTDPFSRYENFFNIHVVDVISNQSGADDPGAGIVRDTALDATYYFDGVTERLLYIDDALANSIMAATLAGTGFTDEMRYVTVNSTKYGGGGGYYATFAGGNTFAHEVGLHELGHSFAGLADEYGGFTTTYTGAEPSEINVTTNPAGTKWSEWLGYVDPILGTVGAYQGGRYYDQGIYRPTADSKMRTLERPFDPIAREEFIHRFYQFVDPLDGYDSNAGPRTNLQTLNVDVIDPAVILVDWTVNGTTVTNAGQTLNLRDSNYGFGSYTVTARAYDPTIWVRGDRSDLEQVVTWTVNNDYRLVGTNAGETLAGNNNGQEILGLDGADSISGLGGIDQIFGGIGNDSIDGGAGNDLIYGEAGTDQAHYSGARQTYSVLTYNSGGQLVTRVGDTTGAAGVDLMIGVERLAFNDGVASANGAQLNRISNVSASRFDDIVFHSTVTGQSYGYVMNGGAVASNGVLSTTFGAAWQARDTGDMNGDGRGDVIYQNTSTGAVAMGLMGASGVASTPTISNALSSAWRLVGVQDIDGDAWLDLVVQNNTTGAVSVGDMTGTTLNTWATVSGQGTVWQARALGDVNGDGRADIIYQNTTTGVISAGLTTTGGTISGYMTLTGGETAAWTVKEAADMNKDGFADVLIQHNTNGNVSYVNMANGAPTSYGTVMNGFGTAWQLEGVADTNNDGDWDAVIRNVLGSGDSYVVNMQNGGFQSFTLVAQGIGSQWFVV